MKMEPRSVSRIVRWALREDIGSGDVTTERTIPKRSRATGEIVAKEKGVVAGLEVVREVYRQVDPKIHLESAVEDGRQVRSHDVLALVSGPTRGILTAERTALNFLQRLSGIATETRRYVQAIAGTGAVVLDTRKTTPGLRLLEKYAVRVGGGSNHRIGLYDMVLIKDNHLQVVGQMRKAIARGRKGLSHLPVEVEVKNLTEVKEAVEANVDRIMLDNMNLSDIRAAVSYVKKSVRGIQRIEVEVSGGIHLATVRRIAETGVDFISVGALTHSSRALDIAFYLK